MKFHNSPLLKILSSKTKRKIVDFFLSHKASMSEREIASILKVSHMSINRTMRQLAELNLVNFTTIGKAHMWKVNRKSYTFRILAQLTKNNLIISDSLEDLKDSLLKNIPKDLVRRVVLFGSIAKGLEKTNSDIDIFILVNGNNVKAKLESHIEKLVNICLDLYGNRLAAYVLTKNELKNRRNLDIITEIEKGIELFPQKKDEK